MKAIALVVGMGLAGCAVSADNAPMHIPEVNLIIRIDAPMRSAIEAGVRDVLKDPASATFREIHASSTDKGGRVACGLVNAKNSYGGFTGDQPFMGLIEERTKGKKDWVFLAAKVGGSGIETQVTLTICKQKGINPYDPPVYPKT